MTRPAVDVALDGGRCVRIRQAFPADAAALEAGFAHLSDDSRYTRFFTAMPRLSGRLLGQLTDVDDHWRVAIAAFDPERPSEVGTDDGLGIGVARFVRLDDEPSVAELAVSVIDAYHGHGIGRVLTAALFVAASERDVERMRAWVLTTNTAMIGLLEHLGGTEVELDPPDASVRQYELVVDDVLGGDGFDEGLLEALRAGLVPA